jgi:solute carrier family 8 (sodium/calcium exchanger)
MGNIQCNYQGNLLPLFGDDERDLPNAVRLPLYLLGLGWTFLAIGMISDIFMGSIEKITSKKKRIKHKITGRTVTVKVWNDTVANLTLMALGSSAPEILLSVIEILTADFFLGELGAGTIVGSAAFNLLCISAVCICAPPDEEVRFIKEMNVYIITASCSVFAYLWLVFILMAPPTPNVCSIQEAVLTLMFCPALVYAAYLADRGLCSPSRSKEGDEEPQLMAVIPENVTKEEIAQIEQQIRTMHGAHLTDEQIEYYLENEYFHTRSRAYYKHNVNVKSASRQVKSIFMKDHGEKIGHADDAVTSTVCTSDALAADHEICHIGFATARYAFLENCGHAKLDLVRKGLTHLRASVKYKTRDGTALAGSDYGAVEGIIYFDKEEERKVITIKIMDDNAYEENEEFYVDLFDPLCDCEGDCEEVCEVVIALADCPPSCIRPDAVSSTASREKK